MSTHYQILAASVTVTGIILILIFVSLAVNNPGENGEATTGYPELTAEQIADNYVTAFLDSPMENSANGSGSEAVFPLWGDTFIASYDLRLRPPDWDEEGHLIIMPGNIGPTVVRELTWKWQGEKRTTKVGFQIAGIPQRIDEEVFSMIAGLSPGPHRLTLKIPENPEEYHYRHPVVLFWYGDSGMSMTTAWDPPIMEGGKRFAPIDILLGSSNDAVAHSTSAELYSRSAPVRTIPPEPRGAP